MRRYAQSLALLAALVAGPAMLTACSSNSTTTAGAGVAGAASVASAKAASLSLPEGVSNATDVPSAVPNQTPLRKGVELTSCEKVAGGWQAAGTATNPASKGADYTITVFFTTARATVIGTGNAHVHVDADKSADWKVTGTFTAPSTTHCVIRGIG